MISAEKRSGWIRVESFEVVLVNRSSPRRPVERAKRQGMVLPVHCCSRCWIAEAWISANHPQTLDGRSLVFPGAPAFVTVDERPMTVRMIQYMVQKYGRAAGIATHVHPHLIRHSIASHLVDEGCHIEAVRQTLGHEDLATTSIYLNTSSRFLTKEHGKFNPADKLLNPGKT